VDTSDRQKEEAEADWGSDKNYFVKHHICQKIKIFLLNQIAARRKKDLIVQLHVAHLLVCLGRVEANVEPRV
jgi:hypothetical protein